MDLLRCAASIQKNREELIRNHFARKTDYLSRLHADLSARARLAESLAKLDRN